MATSILEFHDDIFRAIFAVAEFDDRVRFAAFGAVCRRFHALAYDLPYECLDIEGDESPFKNIVTDIIKYNKIEAQRARLGEAEASAALVAAVRRVFEASSFLQQFNLARVLRIDFSETPLCLLPLTFEYFPRIKELSISQLTKNHGRGGGVSVPSFDLSTFERLRDVRIHDFKAGYVPLPLRTLERLTIWQYKNYFFLNDEDNSKAFVPFSPKLVEDITNASSLVELNVGFSVPLARLLNLRELTLTLKDENDIIEIENFPGRQLERLRLDFPDIGDPVRFPNLTHLSKSLRRLEIFDQPDEVPQEHTLDLDLRFLRISSKTKFSLEAFKDQRNLNKVVLVRPYDDQCFSQRDLEILSKFKKLRSLFLRGEFSFEHFRVMFPILFNLSTFRLDYNLGPHRLRGPDVREILLALSPPKLVALVLDHVAMSLSHFQIISSFVNLSSLSLTMGGESAPDDDWAKCLSSLVHLESLTLSRITNANYGPGAVGFDSPTDSKVSLECLAQCLSKMRLITYLYCSGFTVERSAPILRALLPPEMRGQLHIYIT